MLFRLNMLWQKLTRGYSDEEIWKLSTTIAAFVLPRLKEFRKQYSVPFPKTDLEKMIYDCVYREMEKEQLEGVDEMIYAMQSVIDETGWTRNENYDRCKAGLLLFGERFLGLWI
jgi:hypothetical protein